MIKLIKFYFILQFTLLSFYASAYQDFNILEAEVTGRAVIIDNNGYAFNNRFVKLK